MTEGFCRTDPVIAQVFAQATFVSDNRADLPELAVPTLVIQTAQDAIAPREVGQFVHDEIRGSSLVTLDAIGHYPQLSAPELTAAAIIDFVNES
ncbi:alpha/beta fold hydrolase [Nocardia sp. NBC_01388]|uniref:alpha/beta fold hydrolase n=1 Tax=Nocardia sp. NBC_01388 TaxID=2903596 RepID=UPI00386AA350